MPENPEDGRGEALSLDCGAGEEVWGNQRPQRGDDDWGDQRRRMYSKQTPPKHTHALIMNQTSPPTHRQQLACATGNSSSLSDKHPISALALSGTRRPSRLSDSSVKQGWMIPAHRFPLPTKSFSDRRTAWCYHLASVLLPHPTQYTLAWLTHSIVCVCESVTAGNQFILLLLF